MKFWNCLQGFPFDTSSGQVGGPTEGIGGEGRAARLAAEESGDPSGVDSVDNVTGVTVPPTELPALIMLLAAADDVTEEG